MPYSSNMNNNTETATIKTDHIRRYLTATEERIVKHLIATGNTSGRTRVVRCTIIAQDGDTYTVRASSRGDAHTCTILNDNGVLRGIEHIDPTTSFSPTWQG